MIICDACKGSPIKRIIIKVLTAKDENVYDLDFCEGCEAYVHPNSMIIGIQEQRKHEGA